MLLVLVKFGWRRVATEEDVGTRWAEGRVAGTARLMIGGSRAGGGRRPSRGEGESGGELGMSIAERRRTGDTDGDSSLSAPMSLPLSTLACLLIAVPLSGGSKPLGGRARGLEGRPVA